MRTSPKPSVLHVYKDYYPPVLGGIEKCVHWMADATRDEFHVNVLVASRDARLRDEVIDGVRVVRVPCLGRVFSSPLSPAYPPWIRRLEADILHFHMPNPVGELSLLLARPQKARVVATWHSDIVRQRIFGLLYRPIQKVFLNKVEYIMPTSRRYIESSKILAPLAHKCRVVPLGVPVHEYEESAESRVYQKEIEARSPGAFRVVFIGVLRYYKGLKYLIEAIGLLRQSAPQVRLVIGGDGPERPRLENQVRQAGLSDSVEFTGALSDARAVGLRAAGHVFCLPAHLRSEAFGLCQIEAMLAGLPVVSTDLDTGVPEVNRDGESGLIVPPANPKALAEALRRLVNDEDLRRCLGVQARARALENYTAEHMGARLKDIYRLLVKRA
jgi:rhamnosyl/mannosyltransferase